MYVQRKVCIYPCSCGGLHTVQRWVGINKFTLSFTLTVAAADCWSHINTQVVRLVSSPFHHFYHWTCSKYIHNKQVDIRLFPRLIFEVLAVVNVILIWTADIQLLSVKLLCLHLHEDDKHSSLDSVTSILSWRQCLYCYYYSLFVEPKKT